MKKIASLMLLMACLGMSQAQKKESRVVPISFDTVGADTATAIAIIDRYLKKIDFSQTRTDSILCVVTYVTDRDHPLDTITIYRWYMQPQYNRTEIWQDGKIMDGYYSDGVKLFRKFHGGRREWANLTPESYYENTLPLDIRGALYNWRTKGAEVYYAGEVNFQGHMVDRVFVTSPSTFDRYYYFEKESGMLGLLVEEEHIYGDQEPARNAMRVDWRAWHEFVPVKEYYLPREESYQYNEQQIVILRHSYHYEAPNQKLFTEDFHQKR